MKKNIIGCIIAFVLAIAIAAPLGYFAKGLKAEEGTPESYKYLTIEDLNLPERFDNTDYFGLYTYNASDAKYYAMNTDKDTFDVNKPTYIFTHGMASCESEYEIRFIEDFACEDVVGNSASYWANAGYNVLVFRWGPFASDALPMAIQKKIWGTDDETVKMRYYYRNEEGKDVASYEYSGFCVAEIMGTYISDYLSGKSYNKELRISGHSMGAQLVIATASYMNRMVQAGKMDKNYLPSRVTMFDPYTSNQIEPVSVRWLNNRVIGNSGTISLMAEEATALKNSGVAVEYMLTGLANFGESIMGPDFNGAKRLKEAVNILDYDDTYLYEAYSSGSVDYTTYISYLHICGYGIYASTLAKDIQIDHTTGGYGFSAKTPTSYSIACMENYYSMEENNTASTVDDVQSSNIDTQKVAGFAFIDENGNGINDETMAKRLKDVEISLYADEVLVATVSTNEGGYYEFTVADKYVGKSLKLKVTTKDGFTFTKTAEKSANEYGHLMTNNFENNYSKTFKLKALEYKILNAGFKKA